MEYFVGYLMKAAGKVDTLPMAKRSMMTASDNGLIVSSKETASKKGKKSFVGRRLGESNGLEVVLCTGPPGTLAGLKMWCGGSVDYRYESLESAWQNKTTRDMLIALGIPTIAGEFGPDPSIKVRPTLPVVYCGQNHDPFAPEV